VKKTLKPKTTAKIGLISLLTLTLLISILPMGMAAGELCDITFADAKIFKEDGSTEFVSIPITVEKTDGTLIYSGLTPETLQLENCTWYFVYIPCNIESAADRQYRFWKWNMIGDVDMWLYGSDIIGDVPTLIFKVHPKCIPSTLEPKYARSGPVIDQMRLLVIKTPDAQLIGMQTEAIHVLTDLIRTGDIEKMDRDGFTITSAPGFHMGHIGFNIRPDQSYRVAYGADAGHVARLAPILSDPNFRHAMFHCYNQEEIVASIYKYIVTPIRSLVPPALGGWGSPAVPTHPFNPGDKNADTNAGTCGVECSYVNRYPNDHSASGILRAGGYIYMPGPDTWAVPYDLDGDGTPGTMADTDCDTVPDAPGTVADCMYHNYIMDADDVLEPIHVYTPTYEVAPTSAEHGARFIGECNNIGLPLIHEPFEFAAYLEKVFGQGDFDGYMVFWGLGRFPDHLYDMCHSENDVSIYPWRYNAPGIDNSEIDRLTEIIKYGLNHAEKLAAAHQVQEILYDPEYPTAAFGYMQLYSRIYFEGFNPDLRGIVNSPGYGAADTGAADTHVNIHWAPGTEYIEGGKTTIVWCLQEEPERLNPLYAHTVYARDIIDKTLGGFIGVNPYTHRDLQAMAVGWEIKRWATPTDMATVRDAPAGTTWHEAWPEPCGYYEVVNWDDNGNGILDVSDYLTIVDEAGVESTWHVDEIAWDMEVEPIPDVCDPWDFDRVELKLHATGGLIDLTVPVGTDWTELCRKYHTDPNFEEWTTDNYGAAFKVSSWTDIDGSGDLTYADEVGLDDGVLYHVDDVTYTLMLNLDGTIMYVEFVGTGQKIKYFLRRDVFWQDGEPYTAHDAKFNWEFLRDNAIPRYFSAWEHIYDVAVPHDYKAIVYLDITGQFYLYDCAGIAALIPPVVWERFDGKPLETILGYDPSVNATDPSADPNRTPWFGIHQQGPMNQLYGTGPFLFDHYDPVGMEATFYYAPHYWQITTDMHDDLVEQFHEIGDVNRDGEVWGSDKTDYSLAYGCIDTEPCYNADCDFNEDGIVDALDGVLISFYWGDKREYP
jgi:ABC-type transport system substrate-binding protein